MEMHHNKILYYVQWEQTCDWHEKKIYIFLKLNEKLHIQMNWIVYTFVRSNEKKKGKKGEREYKIWKIN